MGYQPRATPDYSLLQGVRAYRPVESIPAEKRIIPSGFGALVTPSTPIPSPLRAVDVYSEPRPEPEQNPPQSVSGAVPFQQAHYTDTPIVMTQSGPIPWGVTTRQAVDALASVFGQAAPEPISDDSGARDCLVWYDAL